MNTFHSDTGRKLHEIWRHALVIDNNPDGTSVVVTSNVYDTCADAYIMSETVGDEASCRVLYEKYNAAFQQWPDVLEFEMEGNVYIEDTDGIVAIDDEYMHRTLRGVGFDEEHGLLGDVRTPPGSTTETRKCYFTLGAEFGTGKEMRAFVEEWWQRVCNSTELW